MARPDDVRTRTSLLSEQNERLLVCGHWKTAIPGKVGTSPPNRLRNLEFKILLCGNRGNPIRKKNHKSNAALGFLLLILSLHAQIPIYTYVRTRAYL